MSQEAGKQFVIEDEQHTSACCLLDTSTFYEGLAIQRNTSKRDTKPFPTSRIFSTVLRGSSLLTGWNLCWSLHLSCTTSVINLWIFRHWVWCSSEPWEDLECKAEIFAGLLSNSNYLPLYQIWYEPSWGLPEAALAVWVMQHSEIQSHGMSVWGGGTSFCCAHGHGRTLQRAFTWALKTNLWKKVLYKVPPL